MLSKWVKTVNGTLINLSTCMSVKLQAASDGSDPNYYVWAHGEMLHKGTKQECQAAGDIIWEFLGSTEDNLLDLGRKMHESA